jgi:hypothetical protein
MARSQPLDFRTHNHVVPAGSGAALRPQRDVTLQRALRPDRAQCGFRGLGSSSVLCEGWMGATLCLDDGVRVLRQGRAVCRRR